MGDFMKRYAFLAICIFATLNTSVSVKRGLAEERDRVAPSVSSGPSAVITEGGEKPNVILIMVDDMGFSDIGCYGGEVETANLDRLARGGMRFTQFYNNAKCTTTRASILTGLYPRGTNSNRHLRANMVTLGEVMQQCGYRTALCGKWHLGRDKINHPFYRGFDSFYGLLDGCCNFFNPAQPDPKYKGGRTRVFGENDKLITDFPTDFYTTDAFTSSAIEAIYAADRVKQPFFIHLTYTAPHYPIQAKPADIAKYRGKFSGGWDAMRENRFKRQQEMGLAAESWKLSQGESQSYAWADADQDFEDHRMAVYAAMIESVDQNIGRLLQTLAQTGHDEDTLILFLSDNGGCAEEPGGRDPKQRNPGPGDDYVAVGPAWGWAQNAPFRRYKSWLNEGGITTPMIAWWPKVIPHGTINRDVAHIIDFLPTLVELGGGDYPKQFKGIDVLPVEGKSMVSLLEGKSRKGHSQICWQWAGNRAIREGNWKLVWDKLNSKKRWQLYDLAIDRCEINDMADQHPKRVERMSNQWFDWAEEMELKVKRK
jgi:arylsulfatase